MAKRLPPKQLVSMIEEAQGIAASIAKNADESITEVAFLREQARNFCQPGSAGLVIAHLDQITERLSRVRDEAYDIKWLPTEEDEPTPTEPQP